MEMSLKGIRVVDFGQAERQRIRLLISDKSADSRSWINASHQRETVRNPEVGALANVNRSQPMPML